MRQVGNPRTAMPSRITHRVSSATLGTTLAAAGTPADSPCGGMAAEVTSAGTINDVVHRARASSAMRTATARLDRPRTATAMRSNGIAERATLTAAAVRRGAILKATTEPSGRAARFTNAAPAVINGCGQAKVRAPSCR